MSRSTLLAPLFVIITLLALSASCRDEVKLRLKVRKPDAGSMSAAAPPTTTASATTGAARSAAAPNPSPQP